jgi:glycosyltransferase involved in cell wall biosynthesis
VGKILLTHPTGNTFSRALLRGLSEAGELGLFATTICVQKNRAWLNAVPGKIRAELLRRDFELPQELLFTRPFREAVRMAASRLKLRGLVRHETGFASFDAVYQDLDRALARELPRLVQKFKLAGVYAYEGGALNLFKSAKAQGLKCYYDLPIAYWETGKRLLSEEAVRWPEWASTLLAVRDSDAKCQKKTEEIQLADVVICPSQFVLDSLPASIRERRRCIVAEFGSPERSSPPLFRAPVKKIRVLFAGSMTQRKGLADVFAAMKLVKRSDIELVVLGSPAQTMSFYREQFGDFIYEAPRPHGQVLKLMESCDALLLPSIVEGRALVQQEAMSSGLLLIATANAGGEDLIREGETGFLVPIRSPEKIAERLVWLAENRTAIPEMKRCAYEYASALTWSGYTEKIIGALSQDLSASRTSPMEQAR